MATDAVGPRRVARELLDRQVGSSEFGSSLKFVGAGRCSRSATVRQLMTRETRATSFAWTVHDGRLLAVLHERLGTELWEVPGGHVEPGETFEEAVAWETPTIRLSDDVRGCRVAQ